MCREWRFLCGHPPTDDCGHKNKFTRWTSNDGQSLHVTRKVSNIRESTSGGDWRSWHNYSVGRSASRISRDQKIHVCTAELNSHKQLWPVKRIIGRCSECSLNHVWRCSNATCVQFTSKIDKGGYKRKRDVGVTEANYFIMERGWIFRSVLSMCISKVTSEFTL